MIVFEKLRSAVKSSMFAPPIVPLFKRRRAMNVPGAQLNGEVLRKWEVIRSGAGRRCKETD
jgi:hypothetical protein